MLGAVAAGQDGYCHGRLGGKSGGRSHGQRRSRPWDSWRVDSPSSGWMRGPAGLKAIINSRWFSASRGGCSSARPSGNAVRRRQGSRTCRVALWRRGVRGRISDLRRVGFLLGARRGRSMMGDTRRGGRVVCRARAIPGGYGQNRSESSDGGGKTVSTAGTAIVGGRYTSGESPRRSREVVHAHTWPVCAKIATSEEANGSPPKPALSG